MVTLTLHSRTFFLVLGHGSERRGSFTSRYFNSLKNPKKGETSLLSRDTSTAGKR